MALFGWPRVEKPNPDFMVCSDDIAYLWVDRLDAGEYRLKARVKGDGDVAVSCHKDPAEAERAKLDLIGRIKGGCRWVGLKCCQHNPGSKSLIHSS